MATSFCLLQRQNGTDKLPVVCCTASPRNTAYYYFIVKALHMNEGLNEPAYFHVTPVEICWPGY
jgi:hypothetical protein